MSNRKTQVKEILEKHGLDFKIEKHPLIAAHTNGKNLITPYYGLFNSQSGNCINVAKEGYTVSQNADVVDMVLQGMEQFGKNLSVSKAGSINDGRRVFIQLKIDGLSKVGKDEITRYVTVVDSNDGSTSLSVGIGDTAAHCLNQFFKFYKMANSKFRHTATIDQKIASIPGLIQIALKESLKQVEIYKKFLSTPLTKNLADKMVKEVLGYDRVFTSADELEELSQRSLRMMNTLYENIETEYGMVGENLYGLFNGVTRYTTYHQSNPDRHNGKEESLIAGTAYKKAMAGFDFCMAQL